jgi:hypothetical protein
MDRRPPTKRIKLAGNAAILPIYALALEIQKLRTHHFLTMDTSELVKSTMWQSKWTDTAPELTESAGQSVHLVEMVRPRGLCRHLLSPQIPKPRQQGGCVDQNPNRPTTRRNAASQSPKTNHQKKKGQSNAGAANRIGRASQPAADRPTNPIQSNPIQALPRLPTNFPAPAPTPKLPRKKKMPPPKPHIRTSKSVGETKHQQGRERDGGPRTRRRRRRGAYPACPSGRGTSRICLPLPASFPSPPPPPPRSCY